jgi:hypothetical protein
VKIVIAGVRDTGGTAWNLAHAINKVTDHYAVDLTAQRSYINYPQTMDMTKYSKSTVRKIVYQADCIVFLSAFTPLLKGFRLSKKKLRDKKKLMYYCGSEWRYSRKELLQQIESRITHNYDVAVATPGMMLPGEDDEATACPDWVKFLPWTRSFTEIKQVYGMCEQDADAVRQFTIPKQRVVFMHAPTSEANKGSATFYRAMTQCMQMVPNLTFSSVRGQPWANCLRAIAASNLVFDQDPPFPEAYGAITVEASIFKLPVISRMAPDCIEWYKQNEGLQSPIIQWRNDADLLEKMYHLATNEELRDTFGEATYNFCKALHDEQPVVERFLKIVEGIS